MKDLLSKDDLNEQMKAIRKAEKALTGVNRELFDYWRYIYTNYEDERVDIEVQMSTITDCLDVLKEMLREREEF